MRTLWKWGLVSAVCWLVPMPVSLFAASEPEIGTEELHKAALDGWPPRPIVDLRYYEALRKDKLWGSEASHFPDKLPKGSRLLFFPPILQGGLFFAVALPATPEEMDAVAAKFPKATRLSEFPKDTGRVETDVARPACHFFKEDPDASSYFEEEKDVIMLKMDDHESGKTSFRWNHGTLTGVAFDRKRSLIIYFAQSW